MSYLIDGIRKQVTLMQSCCYNIEQMAKQEFEKCLEVDNPNTDTNVAKLNQIDNIAKLCEMVKNRCGEMEICLGIAEDMEASNEDSEYRGQTVKAITPHAGE